MRARISVTRGVITDPGVAVYFTLRREPQVIAQDRFASAAANLRSIGLVVAAMRTIQRHGGGAMADRAMTGFAALPPPPSCWEILSLEPGASHDAIERAYRALALKHHPDRGGSGAAMAALNAARDEALRS